MADQEIHREGWLPAEPKLEQALTLGGIPIDEVIAKHLADCAQCKEAAVTGGPRGLGQRSRHCGTYWQLQLERAHYEGKINNVVAHTELGDEAPVRGKLD